MHVYCAVVTTVLGKYVDFLNDVSTANYEKAVTCDVAKLFFSAVELGNSEHSASLDACLLGAVKSFISADDAETVVRFCCFIAFYVSIGTGSNLIKESVKIRIFADICHVVSMSVHFVVISVIYR